MNTNTASDANVNANVNTYVPRTVAIKNPDARATSFQLRIIGHTIKEHNLQRYTQNEWNALTKGEAHEIIAKFYAEYGEPLASDFQKETLKELIHQGFLKGLKPETYRNLTADQARRMIHIGQQNKKAGTTVEGFEPHEALAPNAPMSTRQKERLTQLVKDGYLNRFNYHYFRNMTHENASKFIRLGKWRESQGIKAEPYVRPETEVAAAA